MSVFQYFLTPPSSVTFVCLCRYPANMKNSGIWKAWRKEFIKLSFCGVWQYTTIMMPSAFAQSIQIILSFMLSCLILV